METSSAPTPPYAEVLPSRDWDWTTTLFLLLSPVAAGLAVFLDVRWEGFQAVDLGIFLLMYSLCGMSITVGYHRLFSHRTFEVHPAVRAVLLVFGAASVQNTLLDWASNHRYHHQYSDREGDPYSVKRGFFWAHMGWMLKKYPGQVNRPFRNAEDLKADPLVRLQARYYWLIVAAAGLGFPALVGAAFGRPLAGLVWGGLVRMVIAHHATFMINSVAHTFGRATHARGGTARDSHWLAFISFGEGYHSFHHAFSGDYRIGARAWEWDPGKWAIRGLEAVGLARALRVTGPRRALTSSGSLEKAPSLR